MSRSSMRVEYNHSRDVTTVTLRATGNGLNNTGLATVHVRKLPNGKPDWAKIEPIVTNWMDTVSRETARVNLSGEIE